MNNRRIPKNVNPGPLHAEAGAFPSLQDRNVHQTSVPKTTGRTFFQRTTQLGSAILIALLPKCGLCLSAYLHLAGLMGLSMTRYYAWIIPILSLMLVSTLTISFAKARREGDYTFFLLSLAGAAAVMTARLLAIGWLSWTGIGLLTAAALAQMLIPRTSCNQSKRFST